jgi:hypothetical protein
MAQPDHGPAESAGSFVRAESINWSALMAYRSPAGRSPAENLAARLIASGAAALAMVAVAGCNGDSNATIGGTLTGLRTGVTLTLQNNFADNLSLTANGTFGFPSRVAANKVYSVTVLTQPLGQTCTVSNGSGTTDTAGDAVTNVAIDCATDSLLGGTVSGLNGASTLTLNATLNNTTGVTLPITLNGPFSFTDPLTLTAGTTYTVSVVVQPVGQTCTVSNPTGTIVGTVFSSVTVTCQ